MQYGWKRLPLQKSHTYLSSSLSEILAGRSLGALADLGCGNGELTAKLSKHVESVVGFEPDDEGYELAMSLAPQISVKKCSVSEIPAIENMANQFDCVISAEVIEHLYEPATLCKAAAHLLKPNGLLILTTPYHGYFKNLALSLFNGWDRHWDPLWDGGHIKFWSSQTITKLLAKNGFEVIDISGSGRFWPFWCSMIVQARKGQ